MNRYVGIVFSEDTDTSAQHLGVIPVAPHVANSPVSEFEDRAATSFHHPLAGRVAHDPDRGCCRSLPARYEALPNRDHGLDMEMKICKGGEPPPHGIHGGVAPLHVPGYAMRDHTALGIQHLDVLRDVPGVPGVKHFLDNLDGSSITPSMSF